MNFIQFCSLKSKREITLSEYKWKTGQKPAMPVNSRPKPNATASKLNQKRYLIMIL